METQNDRLKVSGTINNIPTTRYNTQITISPINLIVSKIEIKEVGLIWDSVVEPVNGCIEIEYGKEYVASVVEYTDTYSGKKYSVSENPDRTFCWNLEYKEYDTAIIKTSEKIAKEFKFKLQKCYMADDNIKICVRMPNYEDIFVLELKVKFKFEFDRKELVNSLNKRKKEPYKIEQPGPLCGIAAPCYIWAKHHFKEYAETVLELHAMGKVKINDFSINPDSHLYKLETSRKKSTYDVADWVLMASIRDSENDFFDYGDTYSESYSGITTATTVKKLLTKMCKYTIIDSEEYLGLLNKIPPIRWTIDGTKERIDKINNYYVKNNYETLLMIDSDLIQNISNYEPDYHWVVYQGNLVKSDSRAKFEVYSWGDKGYTVNDPFERIRRNWYQYLVVKCVK